MAKTFKVSSSIEITCNFEKTRNGFRHRARVYEKGKETDSCFKSYLNRTWESFEFESVLREALEKSRVVKKDQIETVLKEWERDSNKEVASMFGVLAGVMMMGEIFSNGDQKASNNWKTRMLKAGVPELSLPDDWDQLPEDVKESRLDEIINEFQNKEV